MTRTYEEVIQRMGQSMYDHAMGGGFPYEGLVGVELTSFIYGVPMRQVRYDAVAAYEALWPENETPA
jgi:hypothetical protein